MGETMQYLHRLGDDPEYERARIRTLRRQVAEMHRIRDFVMSLDMPSRKPWVDALQPLTDRLCADLQVCERSGSPMALLIVTGEMDELLESVREDESG